MGGRSAVVDGAPLCHRIEELAGLGEMVPSFQQAACRRLSDDGRMVFAKCYASCRYQAQFDHQEPRVIFTSHAYLRWQLPVQGDVSLRIIDEAFWSTLQHSQRLLLDAWLTAPRPKTVTEQWQGHWDTAHAGRVGAAKRLRDAKGPLVYDYGSIARIGEAGSIVADALREGRSPIVALEDAGIDETLVERFADWEIRDLPEAPVRLEQNSAMQAEIIRSFNTAERKAALARHRVWRLIADDFEYGETGRLSWRALGPCQVTGQPLHAIGLHVRHDLPLDAPILMIDADFSPLIVGAYAPTTRFVRVDAEQTAEVVQVSDRTMSTTWFLDPEKGRGRRDLVRAIIADEVAVSSGPVLLVATKKVLRALHKDIDPDGDYASDDAIRSTILGTQPAWFGPSMRGINRYRDWPRMIVLGRLEPPMNEVETVARAIFGVVPPVFDGNRQRSVLSAAYTMVDGSERLTEISGLPYPEGNAVLMQMREVLTNQAIARLRLVAPDGPKDILILCKIPVPDLPASTLLKWEDIASPRLRAAMAVAPSVADGTRRLRLSAQGLHEDAPSLFGTLDAAKSWRRGKSTDALFDAAVRIAAGFGCCASLVEVRGANGGRPTPAVVVTQREAIIAVPASTAGETSRIASNCAREPDGPIAEWSL